jgi:hypothetical protein
MGDEEKKQEGKAGAGGGEEKKPSSLRKRIDRKMKTYEQPVNMKNLAIGVVIVIIAGAALVFLFWPKGKAGPVQPKQGGEAGQVEGGEDNPGPPPPPPPSVETQVFDFVNEAKEMAKKGDVEGGVAKLEGALGRWPEYDAEIYFAWSVCISQKDKLTGEDWNEKLRLYLKAKEIIDGGGKWAYDPIGNRTAKLTDSIETCREKTAAAK